MMVQKKWLVLIFGLFTVFCGILLYTAIPHISIPDLDMMAVNRIIQDSKQAWASESFAKSPDCPYDYAILNRDGRLLYQSDDSLPTTVHQTIQSHGSVMTVEENQQILGHVLISTGYEEQVLAAKRHLVQTVLLFLLLTLLFGSAAIWYVDRAVLAPFSRLKDFTRHIALGNLDVPLPMDRHHSFGAFTESFDLMREQIREAKKREAKANQSKRELTASLSHDIKTPVTSIKLISELLLATEEKGLTREKIQTIYQKAEQINLLVSNLLQASLEDLGELKVHMTEENSRILEDMINDADCYGAIDCGPVPGCILMTDKLRLSQVIDNILYNSYKYANTSITIRFQLMDTDLLMICQDYGKGVPEEELPFLFQKYYRGSNSSSQTEGSGLGLFISHYLMEKMGGEIRCHNLDNGFCTELFLPLVTPGFTGKTEA